MKMENRASSKKKNLNKTIRIQMNLQINEFLAPEYIADQLISYNVLYFSLTNMQAAVFQGLFVNPPEMKNLFYAFPNGKDYL